ncbi:anti-sigma-D factor RsdA [Mycobacterium vicinigordonae]|uniref:Anti-sigma-D factor RsdA sigma factor binding region domain-containing protein n=1 Tax=Mycobacterium vicinigordonae TaxID=1719132 RepID=A0A7D6DZE5_9MYCO|nr:anti-sigma-D factor RsdA [Mycobacterium vicinigordonae]QLL08427.1 hypothetical protein H0P51_05645 [Mycobacterium vicinigordonae]
MRNHRSDFTRGDQAALDEVAQTDLLLDALAVRAEAELSAVADFEDRALAELLGDWRDDLRWPPASALVSQEDAEDALRQGMSQPRRGGRGLAAVGSVAATLLALSGFGAVVADAKPGDLLYGLHAMMFNEPRVSDDQIVLSAKADLARVEQMIAQGQWDQAQNQLAEVSTTLQGVNDRGRKQGLLAEVNQLNTKLEKREPKATAPAASPDPALAIPSVPGGLPGNTLTPPLAPVPGTNPATPTPSASATVPTVPSVTTTKPPRLSSTTPSPSQTSPMPSSPSTTPPSKGKTKPGRSTSPNSGAAGPGSPAPTSGPVGPSGTGTPFPTGSTP